jgi:hypothetical protein
MVKTRFHTVERLSAPSYERMLCVDRFTIREWLRKERMDNECTYGHDSEQVCHNVTALIEYILMIH